MSIRTMCDPTTPGAVRDEYWSAQTKQDIWLVESHQGLVLETREINGHDDSDFYAVVWNEEKGDVERVTYASTRGWTYPNGAAVDATPEVVAKYQALVARREAEARALAAAREAATPTVGKAVRFVRSVRGKHATEQGASGTVFWFGKDSYDRFGRKFRIGVKLADRKVFVAADAVEVI